MAVIVKPRNIMKFRNILLKISKVISVIFYYKSLSIAHYVAEEFLLCRSCGHEVAKAEDFRHIPSTKAERRRNDTILGVKDVLIQLFENPQGRQFEVITAKTADVYKHDQAMSEHTWFPGFAWRIIVCPRCGAHLGWAFEPFGHKAGKQDTADTFIGLILDHLLHGDYADSLLITPRSYYS